MTRMTDLMARYPDRITGAEEEALDLIFSEEFTKGLRILREQGKLELFMQNLQTIITAAKRGMDVQKFNALLHQEAYLGEPGKVEELIVQCM